MSARSTPIEAGLVALAARRVAPVLLFVGTVILTWFVAYRSTTATTLTAGVEDEALEAGLARQAGLWFVWLVVVPLLVYRAVAVAAPWRRARRSNRDEDASWLAPRAVASGTIVVSTWFGAWIATTVVAGAALLAIELAGGFAPVSARDAGRASGPTARWATAEAPLVWSATNTAPDAARTARVQLGLGAGAGGAAPVELRARTKMPAAASTASTASTASATSATSVPDAANALDTHVTTRIGNRGFVEVPWPRGAREVEFTLSCDAPGARVCVLSEDVELWAPTNRGAATWSIFLRVSLASAAWLALALAMACRTSAGVAAASVLALLAPAWFGSASFAAAQGTSAWALWIPGADVLDALAIVGDGRAPAAPAWSEVGGAILVTLVALVLATRGLRAWRGAR